MNWNLIEYFNLEADPMLACPCCGRADLSMDLMTRVDDARGVAGCPFHINSGYRCPDHDKDVYFEEVAVGTYRPTSSHIKGLALDISAKDDKTRYLIVMSLMRCGFDRIGIARSFVHVDCDCSKPRGVCWAYGGAGSSRVRFVALHAMIIDHRIRTISLDRDGVRVPTNQSLPGLSVNF